MAVRLVLLLALASTPLVASAVELVGKTMPPYPEGLREVGGTCLSDSTELEHICDYSIGMLADANADPAADAVLRYVVAGRLVGRDGSNALWKITDALAYPKAGKRFFWQAGSCRIDKLPDAQVVAVVRQGVETEYLDDVAWARRLDLKTGKFSIVDPARVDCINEGFGEGP